MGVLKKINKEVKKILGLKKAAAEAARALLQQQQQAAAVLQQQQQATAAEQARLEAERVRIQKEERQRLEAERVRIQEEERQRLDLERRNAALQAKAAAAAKEQRQRERQAAQVPAFLAGCQSRVNIGVFGNTGVGKSLFVNAIRGLRPGDHGWAAVGVTETTRTPAPFPLPGEDRVFLWDIPGASTTAFPREVYLRTFGVRHFDLGVVVTSERLTETELMLERELRDHGKAVFHVRTKLDVDIANAQADSDLTPEATRQAILEEFRQSGIAKPYIISSRQVQEHDFRRLQQDLQTAYRSIANSK